MKSDRITAIIPTLGVEREECLEETIKGLLLQSVVPRIVIVDQTAKHSASGARMLASFEHEGAISVVRQREPGTAAARNRGISLASTELLLFLDDDVIFERTLVERHIHNYVEDPNIALVAGQLRPESGDVVDELDSKLLNDPLGHILLPKHYSRRLVGGPAAAGGNFSVRRDVALQVGGFDEQFTGPSIYEDVDFWVRVRDRGYAVVFDPTAWVKGRAIAGGSRAEIYDAHYEGILGKCYYAWRHLSPRTLPFWRFVIRLVFRPHVLCRRNIALPFLLPYALLRFFHVFLVTAQRRAREGMRTHISRSSLHSIG